MSCAPAAKMESNVGVKDEENKENSVAEQKPADQVPVTDEKSRADEENDAPTTAVPVTEAKAASPVDEEPSAVVGGESTAAAAAAPSVENAAGADPVSVEDDKLVVAMCSAKITVAADDVDETQQQEVVAKDSEARDCVDVHSDASVKSSGANEDAAVGDFEDAREYVDENEDRDAEKKEDRAAKSQESVSEGEGSAGEELVEDGEEKNKEPDAPVPVDDDTNDPQYIPRRGRFYEHDDRMAYSTTSSECSESDDEDNSEENEDNENRPHRRRAAGSKKQKPSTSVDTAENTSVATTEFSENTSKKVLAISKAASTVVDASNTTSGVVKKPGLGLKKSRDVDSLDRWTHDMYNEHEQAPKSKDELLASYGYDIREESEAPRARRHHKYGRAATTKYTRNWQDTRAYTSNTSGGQQSNKIKRSFNKTKNKPPNSDEYTSEFPSLDNSKTSGSSVVTVVTQNAEPSQLQQKSPPNEEKKAVVSATGPSRLQEPSSRNPPKPKTPSPNHNSHSDQQNGGTHFPSHNKNYFNRPPSDYHPTDTDKCSQNNQAPPPASNFYNPSHRQQSSDHGGQPNSFKPTYFNNTQGNPRHPSAPRNRHFQPNNSPQQFNRDRYFSKGSGPNQMHFDQSRHNNLGPMTAGTGRTQHGHYNRQYENDNSPSVQMQAPIVRSSKRYSVQSRRELPDPVLNFGNIPKTQQQNGMVVQEQPQSTMQQIQPQQMQPSPQQVMQQQATMQIHQQQPIQLQQYHQPIQQLHPHHSMVLDHNTGMMVMAAADPSMYHHQLYAPPGGNVDDPNTAAAASALQMLATQAAVYQPVPTGVTSSPNTQPESFMTTYYQPLQQPTQQQPPPRRVNLAIPIVAPPMSNQQQNAQKPNASSTN